MALANGISLLIMASILAQMPKAFLDLKEDMTYQLSGSSGQIGPETLIVMACLFVAVVFGVVFITLGQRTYPDAERQACAWSPRVRWYQTVLATAYQSVGRDANHLRQQLDHAARVALYGYRQRLQW